ncbi:MAG: DUF1540 domain-containing protein [Oscillospiraceae bacterium]|nr:DUF1540 domain-containing protein [Oscillospiraceae bacterium]
MPLLRCSVNTCTSNCQSMCCRPQIHISGNSACTSDETDCRSFEAKKFVPMNCLHEYDNPNPSVAVHCDAVNCVFNEYRQCSAYSIDICGKGAEVTKTTACATFKCK